ncbi:MAG: hypothetical protein XD82_0414 [Methanoculleus marisnigri]|uniref:Uncharacterized protein n=1 Tax=Methanoculleus marisnigri TaxID=2198 RepID=A0A117LRI1_9EURY|nr:MAG: hypothetical protein XD82_0414 [Methanoculleus marisnigri]
MKTKTRTSASKGRGAESSDGVLNRSIAGSPEMMPV